MSKGQPTKKRCPRCKKSRRFRDHQQEARRLSYAPNAKPHPRRWHRAEDGLLVCHVCHPVNLLTVACPYTGCGSPPGIQCVNARDGGFLEHGHRERGVKAREVKPCGDCGSVTSFSDLRDPTWRTLCKCGLSLCEPCGDAHSNYDCTKKEAP